MGLQGPELWTAHQPLVSQIPAPLVQALPTLPVSHPAKLILVTTITNAYKNANSALPHGCGFTIDATSGFNWHCSMLGYSINGNSKVAISFLPQFQHACYFSSINFRTTSLALWSHFQNHHHIQSDMIP